LATDHPHDEVTMGLWLVLSIEDDFAFWEDDHVRFPECDRGDRAAALEQDLWDRLGDFA
jgi:hypothetical protein